MITDFFKEFFFRSYEMLKILEKTIFLTVGLFRKFLNLTGGVIKDLHFEFMFFLLIISQAFFWGLGSTLLNISKFLALLSKKCFNQSEDLIKRVWPY